MKKSPPVSPPPKPIEVRWYVWSFVSYVHAGMALAMRENSILLAANLALASAWGLWVLIYAPTVDR